MKICLEVWERLGNFLVSNEQQPCVSVKKIYVQKYWKVLLRREHSYEVKNFKMKRRMILDVVKAVYAIQY